MTTEWEWGFAPLLGVTRQCDYCGNTPRDGEDVLFEADGSRLVSIKCTDCVGHVPDWAERRSVYGEHKQWFLLSLLSDLEPLFECPGKDNIAQTKRDRVLQLRSIADEIERDLVANGYQ